MFNLVVPTVLGGWRVNLSFALSFLLSYEKIVISSFVILTKKSLL